MKKKPTLKIWYIIFAVGIVLFAVWFAIGISLLPPDADGMSCFFAVTLPFLGAFGCLGLILYTAWKSHLQKRKQAEVPKETGETR